MVNHNSVFHPSLGIPIVVWNPACEYQYQFKVYEVQGIVFTAKSRKRPGHPLEYSKYTKFVSYIFLSLLINIH